MHEREWGDFYVVHQGRGPRPFLLDVLARWPSERGRLAVDLGCGTGSEALAMLRAGWRVFAVDAEAEAVGILERRVPGRDRPRLETLIATFDAVPLPPADLVYAGFSLPFCSPELFPTVWEAIGASVARGGRFAGQLFGDRDSWRGSPGMTFMSGEHVLDLLAGWDVETLEEVEKDGMAARGAKHWHFWNVIARQP